ncbi:hypothetical protein AGMMS50262_09280 [Bacteroidia bacterium]|nr:hypothetical protein AGMMS50262_09280 [Bacteroidia bacterium]
MVRHFTAKGSLSAKGSYYPRIEFEIYKILCPWVELIPYVRTDFESGMRASTDDNNYLAWTSKSYAGMDFRGGFNIDAGIFLPLIKLWESDTYNLKDAMLLDMPKKIELVSPENGTKVNAGEPVEVSFKVSSLNNVAKTYFPCIGGLVNFVTNGETDKAVAVSGMDGRVSVKWKPKDKDDQLTAKIVDKDGETISEAVFTPEYNDDEEAQIREMLVKLYHDTDGDNWLHKDNWLSDKPIDEWFGIRYLQGWFGIYLNDNQLKGTIDMRGCTSLYELHCIGNQLTNQLTSLNVSGCTSLAALFCENNQLTSLNVSDCTSLTGLDCTNNKILSEIPVWFKQVTYFYYDVRYSYDWENGVMKYTDKGVGWWYPGEPEKGYHGYGW